MRIDDNKYEYFLIVIEINNNYIHTIDDNSYSY